MVPSASARSAPLNPGGSKQKLGCGLVDTITDDTSPSPAKNPTALKPAADSR